MFIYIIRRLNVFVITLFLLSVVAFLLQRQVITDFVNTGNILSDYQRYILAMLSGNFGTSLASGNPVLTDILAIFPATLELCLMAFVVSILIGIPCGIFAGLSRGGAVDYGIMTITLMGVSVPAFWFAMLLMMFFSLHLGWFPVSGRIGLLYDIPVITGFNLIDTLLSTKPYKYEAFFDSLLHLALPTLVLATIPTTEVIRQVRASIGEEMDKNYIKAAQAKGLNTFQIIKRHGLRNALPPVIPSLGLQFGRVLTTAMITETVFSWPGIGPWMVNSIYLEDHSAIQGGMLFIAAFVLLANMATDLLHLLIDPLKRNELYGKS
ncbi:MULTISPECIES: ABC transporter permease subunit [unclassified Motilimonas]|uniref:ABC transporter permease n=1 Tax=Motilimonas TaxID=1914248 RepID=UPI001E287BDE|nr:MULTISPECIES: ABC transporter permease subunit [unclassified Motilimonas]MCE0557596.1 ABC transporter permease subunit [Motilimonas sp. E26]MDO6526273.1 ABC transporter permease subunit [Motilimonas sp. 1_MG-2023]